MAENPSTPDLPGWVNLPPSTEQSRAAARAALVASLRVGRTVLHKRTNNEEYEIVEATVDRFRLRRVKTSRTHHMGFGNAFRYLRPSSVEVPQEPAKES